MTATDTSAQSFPRFCGVPTFMRTPWAIHHVTGFNPFVIFRFDDVGNVPFTNFDDLEKVHD